MELDEFEEITGLDLTPEQEDQYDSIASRAQVRLERALGWNLSQSDNYTEAGQINNESYVVNQNKINMDTLKDPDQLTNSWRLFPYWDTDTNLKIDPCTAVYNVKIVTPLIGENTEFVTIMNFDYYYPVVGKASGKENYIGYIQKTKDFKGCGACQYWNTNGVMLAVDGEWISNNYPDDLKQILADLIIYGYQNKPSLASDSNRVLKGYTESVDGHSISKTYADVTTGEINSSDPLQDANTIFTLKNYIGPYSPFYERQRVY